MTPSVPMRRQRERTRLVLRIQPGFIWAAINYAVGGFGGGPGSEVAVKILIVLTVLVLGAGSALALMNRSCKTSHHSWCAPLSDIRHHTKTGRA
jgi:hypothetical protein